jgi:hypothetical protein
MLFVIGMGLVWLRDILTIPATQRQASFTFLLSEIERIANA